MGDMEYVDVLGSYRSEDEAVAACADAMVRRAQEDRDFACCLWRNILDDEFREELVEWAEAGAGLKDLFDRGQEEVEFPAELKGMMRAYFIEALKIENVYRVYYEGTGATYRFYVTPNKLEG